ncbi:MAG: transposase [Elusimicrobiota bacterium]
MKYNPIVQTRLKTTNYNNLTVNEKFLITAQGKYMQTNPVCPFCNSRDVVDNGYYLSENKFLVENNIEIKNGHYLCNSCETSFSTPYEAAKKFVSKTKRYIKEKCFKDYMEGKSFGSIANDLSSCWNGMELSEESVRNYYVEIANEFKNRKVLKTSGIFSLDCQHVFVNGNRLYRLSIVDAVTKKCLFDIKIREETVKEVVDRVRLLLLPYNINGFIVDGKIGLKDALEEEFNVPVQLCVTHFQSLIVRNYVKNYGKKMSLINLRNMYLSLNILMNHDVEVQFLNKKLDELNEFRRKIKYSNKEVRNKSIRTKEKQLKKEFYEFRKSLKKYRRKQENYLISRTEEEIKDKLEKAKMFLTGKDLKTIKRVEEKLEALTHFTRIGEMPPTNNTVEHYYSETLTKTRKKRFRNKKALKTRLNGAKGLANGWFKFTVTLKEILIGFAEIYSLFAKPG